MNGESFNFSSNKIKNISVIAFLKIIKKSWPSISWKILKKKKFKESSLLQLNNLKARSKLRWKPKLTMNETVSFVIEWYKETHLKKKNVLKISTLQILNFLKK